MRRLRDNECPLMLQEEFLRSIDITEVSRRARLAIDPDFKYIMRFFVGNLFEFSTSTIEKSFETQYFLGPKESSMCGQATKSGIVEILKGHVFPQWKKRFVSVIGSQLIIFPGDAAAMKVDVINLANANILEHTPTYNRLIIKIVPNVSNHAVSQEQQKQQQVNGSSTVVLSKALVHVESSTSVDCTTIISTNGNGRNNTEMSNKNCNNNELNFYNSHDSVHSTIEKETSSALFFGFEDSWERDLWSAWLHEVSWYINIFI